MWLKVKALGIGRWSWINPISCKSLSILIRKAEGDFTDRREGDVMTDRDWSDVATSQGQPANTGSWRRTTWILSQRPRRMVTPPDRFLSPVIQIVDLHLLEPWEQKCLLFSSHSLDNCYSSCRNLSAFWLRSSVGTWQSPAGSKSPFPHCGPSCLTRNSEVFCETMCVKLPAWCFTSRGPDTNSSITHIACMSTHTHTPSSFSSDKFKTIVGLPWWLSGNESDCQWRSGHANVWVLSCVRLFAIPWTVAHQAPLSMGFLGQEYWSGLPFPTPGDLPDPGIQTVSLASPAIGRRVRYLWCQCRRHGFNP